MREHGVEVSTHLIGGDAVDAVIDVAEQNDAALIVIDSRPIPRSHRGARTRSLLGCAHARRVTCCSLAKRDA